MTITLQSMLYCMLIDFLSLLTKRPCRAHCQQGTWFPHKHNWRIDTRCPEYRYKYCVALCI